jgi:hypothetical protein
MSICRDHREHSPSSSPGSQSAVMSDSPSGMPHASILGPTQTNINQGYYFSFPSFEEWNRDNQDDITKDNDDWAVPELDGEGIDQQDLKPKNAHDNITPTTTLINHPTPLNS